MLDAFKKSGNPAVDLQALVAASREERAALSTMLTQIQLQSSKLAAAGKALQNVEELVGRANERLDQVTERLNAADAKTHVIDEVDRRIAALLEGLERAEQQAARLTAPDGELQEHRRAIDGLAAQAAEAASSLDALRTEHAALEEIRGGVREATQAAAEVARRTAALQADLAKVNGASKEVFGELGRVQELSREVRDHVTATAESVTSVERRLESLAQLQQTSAQAEERITGLQRLAGDVAAQIKALENQKTTVERAVEEANRVDGMIRAIESQIAALHEAGQHASTALRDAGQYATSAQQLVDRVEEMSRAVGAELEQGLRARDEFVAELRKLDEARVSVTEILRLQSDRVAAGSRELDAMDERVKSLGSVTAELERRASTLAEARAHVEEQMRAADEQVERLQNAARAADDRRRDLASADERLGIFQGRLAELQSLTAEVERKMEQVAKRESTINAVRDQVQSVHEVGARVRADLDFLEGHRDGVAVIRQQVDQLCAAIGQAEPQVKALAASAQAVQDVEGQVRSLMGMLEDVRRNVEDGRLADLVREAQSAIANLQSERELAERLQRGMRQARSKNGEAADKKKLA